MGIRMKYGAIRAILACALVGAGYGAVLGSVYAVLSVGGPSLLKDLTEHGIGTTLFMRLMIAPYGAVVGSVYGFIAGLIGGSLGGPLGWGLGGLLPGVLFGLLIIFARSVSGRGLFLLLLLWAVIPGIIGALVGSGAGQAIRKRSTAVPGVSWLLTVVGDLPLADWLWWRNRRDERSSGNDSSGPR
jgi:hypothetical protein